MPPETEARRFADLAIEGLRAGDANHALPKSPRLASRITGAGPLGPRAIDLLTASRLVFVGGGPAALGGPGLREAGADGEVVLVCGDEQLPTITPSPPIPFGCAAGPGGWTSLAHPAAPPV